MILLAYDADGRELKPGMQVKVKDNDKLYYILGDNSNSRYIPGGLKWQN